jgi:hypothetical protein
MSDGYLDTIFASAGDLALIPNTVQPDGSVSFPQGYGANYELPQVDPNALNIERTKMNWMLNLLSAIAQQYQQHATPDFITSAQNGGTPYSYSKYDRVRSGGIVWTSLVNSNTATPASGINWVPEVSGSPSYMSTGNTTIPDSATRYCSFNHISSSAEADVTFVMPCAGIIMGMACAVPTATAGTRIYTLRKNSVDTALTCTSTLTARIATNVTNYVTFVAGDELDLKIQTIGGSDVQVHKASVIIARSL